MLVMETLSNFKTPIHAMEKVIKFGQEYNHSFENFVLTTETCPFLVF